MTRERSPRRPPSRAQAKLVISARWLDDVGGGASQICCERWGEIIHEALQAMVNEDPHLWTFSVQGAEGEPPLVFYLKGLPTDLFL